MGIASIVLLLLAAGQGMSSEDEEDWLSVLEDAAEVADDAHEEPESCTTPGATCDDHGRSESEAQLAGSSCVGEEQHGVDMKWRVQTAAANGGTMTAGARGMPSAATRRDQGRRSMAPRIQRARLARIPSNVQDADDILAKREDERYAAMVAAGTHSAEEIVTLRLRKRYSEEVQVCRVLVKNRAWENDSSCSRRNVFLCLAVRTCSIVDKCLVLRRACVLV